MESKPLKQQIALIVDTMGMRGPVERRSIAEQVYHATNEDYWSSTDQQEAQIQYIMGEVATYMNTPLAAQDIARILPSVPETYRAFLEAMPRFICISERGGRGSKHVMTWQATTDDWESNIKLKEFVVERGMISTDASRAMRDMLIEHKAECLADLGSITSDT